MSSFQSRPKECAIKGRQHSRVGEEKGYLYSSLVYSPKSRGNKEKTLELSKNGAHKESVMNFFPKRTGAVEDNGAFRA